MKRDNSINNSFIIKIADMFHMMIKKSFWLFICLFFILPHFSIANEKIKEAQKILSEMGYEV